MTASLHPETLPSLVYANDKGEILDFSELQMAGRAGYDFYAPELIDIIPLPEGSELFVLPQRFPIGLDPADGRFARLEEDPYGNGEPVQAVAAFMAPAHTTVFTAAYEKQAPDAALLPLFSYTAVGWLDDRFWVCAFRSDPDLRQEPGRYTPEQIQRHTHKKLQLFCNNRLVQHLGKCSLTYGCPAAVNYFMGKWEAPLPTSPACNASCLGCISLQESGCCPATQDRIKFVPTPAEIAEVGAGHLRAVNNAVVSFGQGCEGEPLLQTDTIEKAIAKMRLETDRGTINLNTNGSLPRKVKRLSRAGLDSIRISLNSARPDKHKKYYRPVNFCFEDVLASIDAMKESGKFVCLNYFILPGFTDDPQEFEALCRLVENHSPDFIQLRNLNMDPDWYLEELHHNPAGNPMGIHKWLNIIKKTFPH